MTEAPFKIGDQFRFKRGSEGDRHFGEGPHTVSDIKPRPQEFWNNDAGRWYVYFNYGLNNLCETDMVAIHPDVIHPEHPFKKGDKVRRIKHPSSGEGRGLPYDIGDICEVEEARSTLMEGRVVHQIVIKGRWSGAKWWELAERKEERKSATATLHETVEEVVAQISYKPGWSVLVGNDRPELHGRVYIQLAVNAFAEASMDSAKRDGTRTPWKSAKRYLSPHMCRQELVGAIFGLIKDAEMHEVHEWFRYKNASIFNPHLDPDVLAEVARKKSSYNVRENAMTMEEAEEKITVAYYV